MERLKSGMTSKADERRRDLCKVVLPQAFAVQLTSSQPSAPASLAMQTSTRNLAKLLPVCSKRQRFKVLCRGVGLGGRKMAGKMFPGTWQRLSHMCAKVASKVEVMPHQAAQNPSARVSDS